MMGGAVNDGFITQSSIWSQTGDVQTACLVAGQILPAMIKVKAVGSWLQG